MRYMSKQSFCSEIRNMKAAKVKLMRQIREENSKFQNWRKEKEREVKQLKEKVSLELGDVSLHMIRSCFCCSGSKAAVRDL